MSTRVQVDMSTVQLEGDMYVKRASCITLWILLSAETFMDILKELGKHVFDLDLKVC